VITFYNRKGTRQEVDIIEAVERIQWALREVLTQLPESLNEPSRMRIGSAALDQNRTIAMPNLNAEPQAEARR
jgi:hypothetical protein